MAPQREGGRQEPGGGPLLSAGVAAPAPLLRTEGLVLGAQPGFCSAAQVDLPPEPGWDAGRDGDGAGQGLAGCQPPHGLSAPPPRWGAAPAQPRSAAAGCANLCSGQASSSGQGHAQPCGVRSRGKGCPCPLRAAAHPPSPARVVGASSCPPRLPLPHWWEQMAARRVAGTQLRRARGRPGRPDLPALTGPG